MLGEEQSYSWLRTPALRSPELQTVNDPQQRTTAQHRNTRQRHSPISVIKMRNWSRKLFPASFTPSLRMSFTNFNARS
jgi:hypothetical protein